MSTNVETNERRREDLIVHVDASSASYDVIVGSQLLPKCGSSIRQICGGESAFVVSDTNVAPLYLSTVESSLRDAGYHVFCHVVPAGEQYKRMSTYEGILESMAQASLTRDSIVVALGGGVVGDMAGFSAATYMRGIKVVQLPTTLLAMVDSSVGGKTAIDLAHGKNLAGAFLQPSLVMADVTCLATLPNDVFVDGIGEIVKHGVLADQQLFDKLSLRPLRQDARPDYLMHVVARNVEIKRDVVNADEHEHGLRQTLNLGHTLGHAIEAASGFSLGHGHCVAAGLACVTRGCEQLGWTEPGLSARIDSCLSAQGLPIDTDTPHDVLLSFATHDKKRHGAGVNLVVPRSIGSVEIRPTSLDELSLIIAQGCGVQV